MVEIWHREFERYDSSAVVWDGQRGAVLRSCGDNTEFIEQGIVGLSSTISLKREVRYLLMTLIRARLRMRYELLASFSNLAGKVEFEH